MPPSTMFKPATRKKIRLRMAIDGPSGAGKSLTAQRFAATLGKRIAVIDTEAGSASKYIGDVWDGSPLQFDVCELRDFSPTAYTEAIQAAGAAGYEVIIVDSLSHAWQGPGGALEIVDRKGGNSFTAWKDVTPMHNKMVDAILRSPSHVIVTMRSKMDYILEEDHRGKKVPVKVGMAPIQRQGMEYEFDIVCDMDHTHTMTIGKSRCSPVADAISVKPGANFMAPVLHWLDKGSDIPAELIEAAGITFKPPEEAEAAEPEMSIKERMKLAADKKKAEANGHAETAVGPAQGDTTSETSIRTQTLPAPDPAAEQPSFDPKNAAADGCSPCTKEQRERIQRHFAALATPKESQEGICKRRGVTSFRSFTIDQARDLIDKLTAMELGLDKTKDSANGRKEDPAAVAEIPF